MTAASIPSPNPDVPTPRDAPALSNLLLLCVDLQPAFLKAITAGAEVQRRCEFAVQVAAGLGIEIMFTEQVPAKLGGTTAELLALAARAPVFPKQTFSALGDSAIKQAIEDRQIEHVLLCGIETPICVYQTTLDALAANLQVTVLSDCVAARRPEDARVCLDAVLAAGAHVVPSESVFYALLHDVQHPFFKRYTQLVKHYSA